MSLPALLLFVLAIVTVGLLTSGLMALARRLIGRWTWALLRRRRYSAELPTWGSLCREAMARECARATGLSVRSSENPRSRLVNASESVYHRPMPRHGG